MLAVHDLRALRPAQLDALREMASMGAGHAATALSAMTRQRIMIKVPTIEVAALDDVLLTHVVPDERATVVAVQMQVSGDLTGRALLVVAEPTARRLADLLLPQRDSACDAIGTLEASALKECGNILSGAYLNAMADFLSMRLLPTAPVLAIAPARVVLHSGEWARSGESDVVFCVESEFHLADDDAALRGHFLLLPDAPSLQRMLRALRLD
jgi:chemotaxis protein CheC